MAEPYPAAGDSPRTGLHPVQHRWHWITGGLSLQFLGLIAPVAVIWERTHHDSLGSHITSATVRLGLQEALHRRADLAIMGAGLLVFVIGSVLLARPYARSWPLLLIAVPLAAVAGVAVLGVGILVVAVLAVGAEDFLGWSSNSGTNNKNKKRKKKKDEEN